MTRPSSAGTFKKKVCIICEGYEEYEYLKKLDSLPLWASTYEFSFVNAQSNGNISARYQDKYQNGDYDIVLVFCDTDKKPQKDFMRIRKKIDEIFGVDGASDHVVIFAAPCTLQLNLLHFGDVSLQTQAKKINSPLVERLTGIENYQAKENQRKELFEKMTPDNYRQMKERARHLSEDFQQVPSSNFVRFLSWFESDDASWIDHINSVLDCE